MADQTIPEFATSLILGALNEPLKFEKTPLPNNIPSGSILIRVLSTLVRHHQREGFKGNGHLIPKTPYNPGDGGVDRVISIGSDAVSLKPGQLVYINSLFSARDDPNTRVLLGLHDGGGPEADAKLFDLWGGLWRDFAIVATENAIPLNEKILINEMGYSYGDLSYIQRLSVAYGGIRAAGLRAGQTVIVAPATGHYSGAVVELAAQIGCRVIALSRSASKLEPLVSRHPRVIAVELTGDEKKDADSIRTLVPQGADAYIDVSPPAATASHHHLDISINSFTSFGVVVFLGMMFEVKVNYVSLLLRNITIKAQFMYTRQELVSLVRMIETGVVKLGKEAGHEIVERGFSMEEWEKAVTVAETATNWGQQVLLYP